MALRNILKDGAPGLRKKSRVVTEFNPRLHELLDDMRETMDASNGVGLAAPQVGVLRRAVLIAAYPDEALNEDGRPDYDEEPEYELLELINLEITEKSGEQEDREGCLSVPEVWGMVKRPETVTVTYQDRFGVSQTRTVSGLTARAICHECDHLEGILFTDIVERFLTREEVFGSEEDDTAAED
ncbi:MAG: peptide deformylase [Oscillospiraceae bacterium]|jgi:peptide deformylase|nr:peptide deformylase [Oscillospiraceae bacterium]